MKRRTSDALVELRTVASRAETAIASIRGLPYRRECARANGRRWEERDGPGTHQDYVNLTGRQASLAEDPDEPDMIAALEQVVGLLARWR